MDVFFVAAFRAFATTGARHQFGGWAWRPELDYFAHLPYFNVAALYVARKSSALAQPAHVLERSSLLFLWCAALDLRQRSKS